MHNVWPIIYILVIFAMIWGFCELMFRAERKRYMRGDPMRREEAMNSTIRALTAERDVLVEQLAESRAEIARLKEDRRCSQQE